MTQAEYLLAWNDCLINTCIFYAGSVEQGNRTHCSFDMGRKFTRDEVLSNGSEDSLWCIIDSLVYDLTEFQDVHPGGRFVLLQVGGKDATDDFFNLHRQDILKKYSHLCIGTIVDGEPQILPQKPGNLSHVPYAEPAWLTPQFSSPYYNESHRRLQRAMRQFTDTYIWPEAQEKEVSGERISEELIQRMACVSSSLPAYESIHSLPKDN